jgi:hypothetical protein
VVVDPLEDHIDEVASRWLLLARPEVCVQEAGDLLPRRRTPVHRPAHRRIRRLLDERQLPERNSEERAEEDAAGQMGGERLDEVAVPVLDEAVEKYVHLLSDARFP